MKTPYIFLLLIALLFVACQPKETFEPQPENTCAVNFDTHPKHQAYTELLARFSPGNFVGMTLLVDHPTDGTWIGSAGYADIEQEIPMNPCHLHFAASLNKTYISVIILQLEEEGKLGLDDQLANYIPAEILDKIPNGNEVTIRQLLQCRSGMPDAFEAKFLLDFLNNPTQQYTMEELMKFLYGVQPVDEPGGRHYYGDGNFILLSMIIEKLDGNLSQSFQTRIFQRLGANDSYLIETPGQLPSGVPASYWDRYGDGVLEEVSDYQIALAAGLEGADGLVASVQDMNLFMRGLVNRTLVDSASYDQLMEVIDIAEGNSSQNYVAYGLGIGKVQVSNEVWYGSFGNHVGCGAMMLYNPVHDVSIVAVQNTGTFFNDDTKTSFFGHLIFEIEAVAL